MTGVRYKRRGMPAGGQRRAGLLRLGVMVLIITLVFAGVDKKIRPVIEDMAAYQAKIYSVRCINDAMASELEAAEVRYMDIATVTQNYAGEVTSIQTNMMELNALKNRMVQAIVEELEQEENHNLLIPAGTLLGNQFTSGWGPNIRVQIIPTGYVKSEIYNLFTSAGINQTLHQVMLKVDIEMLAVLPGYTVKTNTATSYCIAQTVIVGSVPEGFTDINGDDSSTISKLNDYSASKKYTE